jgi:2-oxoglutarate dehydrogenase E1 component
VQEESQNNGAWTFVEPRLRALAHAVEYIGRDASASPATGSSQVHKREQKEIVESAIRGEAPHVVRAYGSKVRPRVSELPAPVRDERAAAPAGKS